MYDAVADDGYITIMTRLVNPLADKRHLRYPPIILEHGGTIDPTAYIVSSSIQHHPEKWPRTAEDGPITSWNRSLAFVLANNGFDVWLAETRGSNDANTRKIPAKAVKSVLRNRNQMKNMTAAENVRQMLHANDYWSFSQDDIIAHELKSHIDTVLRITGADHVGLFTFSLSTPTSLAFFSLREDYADKVHGFVSMAPIVSGQGTNTVIKIGLQTICPLLPDEVGLAAFTSTIFTQPMRDLVVLISQSKYLRYSIVKLIVTLLMGPSAKWKSLFDLNLLGHLLRQLSFREAKQLCQQMDTNKLQKYDYGPIKNKLLYNQTEPPVYDLTHLHIRDWIVVAASNDALSTMPVLDHLLTLVEPKPMATILAPGFNHLDLISAMDNDKYVNLPILAYFQSMSHVPGLEEDQHYAEASSLRPQRSLDFSQFFPKIPGLDLKSLVPSTIANNNNNSSGSTSSGSGGSSTISNNSNSLDTNKILESMTKNLQNMLSSLGNIEKFFKMFDPNKKGNDEGVKGASKQQ